MKGVLTLKSPRPVPPAAHPVPVPTTNPARRSALPAANQAPARIAVSTKFILLLAAIQSRNNFAESATVLATELASTLKCERVSIGFLDQHNIRIIALSHQTNLQERQAFLRPIAAAMEEAVLQAATVVLPEQGAPRICLAHSELLNRHGSSELATIPLARNRKVYAALTLERNHNCAFTQEEIRFLENVAALLGPLLDLKRRAQLPWAKFLGERLRETRAALTARERIRAQAVIGAALLLALAASFYPIHYRVSAPARLEGLVQRALAAPSDGFLKQVFVRPGDDVAEGQVLVELADEELALERRKLQGELAQLDSTLGDALAKHDRAQIAATAARIDETRAQLGLAETRLAHAHIKAPFDAVVIKGDLAQSVGAPLRQGDALLVVAPRQGFRVIIDVDERDIADMLPQQSGALTLTAYPDETFAINVARVIPVASTREGRHFFEVEAKLQGPEPRLRPGLVGVAKIQVAQRSAIWVLMHDTWNWLRLAVWSITG